MPLDTSNPKTSANKSAANKTSESPKIKKESEVKPIQMCALEQEAEHLRQITAIYVSETDTTGYYWLLARIDQRWKLDRGRGYRFGKQNWNGSSKSNPVGRDYSNFEMTCSEICQSLQRSSRTWKRQSSRSHSGKSSVSTGTASAESRKESKASTVGDQGTLVREPWIWFASARRVQGKWSKLATSIKGFDAITIT